MENYTQTTKRVIPKLALTRVEAAEALGITPVTIDRLAKRGLLHPSRATRRPLYPVEEIERFLRDTSESIALSGGVQ
jgi:predicted site-specific integrase-resolvase